MTEFVFLNDPTWQAQHIVADLDHAWCGLEVAPSGWAHLLSKRAVSTKPLCILCFEAIARREIDQMREWAKTEQQARYKVEDQRYVDRVRLLHTEEMIDQLRTALGEACDAVESLSDMANAQLPKEFEAWRTLEGPPQIDSPDLDSLGLPKRDYDRWPGTGLPSWTTLSF
jgi:hypothetical protein